MENEKKKNGLVVGIMVALILALLGTTSYIVYDKVIKKDEPKTENKKEDNNNSKENIDENKTNDTEEEIVSADLKSKLKSKLDDLYLYYGHRRILIDELNSESIPNNIKMMVVSRLVMYNSSKIVISEYYDEFLKFFNYSKQEIDTLIDNGHIFSLIKYNDVKNKYYELFGKELTDTSDIPSKCLNWKYIETSKVYIGEGICDSSEDDIFVYNSKYSSKNDEAYIYVSVGEFDRATNNLYSEAYSNGKNYDITKQYKKCEFNDAQKILEENYKDFSEYKVIFKKNTNGDYYFYSVEKVK